MANLRQSVDRCYPSSQKKGDEEIEKFDILCDHFS